MIFGIIGWTMIERIGRGSFKIISHPKIIPIIVQHPYLRGKFTHKVTPRDCLVKCLTAREDTTETELSLVRCLARSSAWFSVVDLIIGVRSVCQSRQQNP